MPDMLSNILFCAGVCVCEKYAWSTAVCHVVTDKRYAFACRQFFHFTENYVGNFWVFLGKIASNNTACKFIAGPIRWLDFFLLYDFWRSIWRLSIRMTYWYGSVIIFTITILNVTDTHIQTNNKQCFFSLSLVGFDPTHNIWCQKKYCITLVSITYLLELFYEIDYTLQKTCFRINFNDVCVCV